MTYHAHLSPDGSVPLPEELVSALGLSPGDRIAVERSGGGIVLRRDDGRSEAVDRLRETLKDYSVDQFLAERRSDWGE